MRVIGIGNRWRSDDAAGLEVARRLRAELTDVLELDGEPVDLLDALEADEVVLVDAVESGAAPGTVHRIEITEQELPRDVFRTSTHAFGLAETIELARALGRLPARVVVYGIEGERFAAGDTLSPAVEAAVAKVVEEVRCTSTR